MAKYASGKFTVKNLSKYVGKREPTYRSSWEFTFMMFCDNNPNVIQWASEPFMIPYRNPFTGKNTVYVPDFMIVYIDRDGKQHAEVIEVKPTRQARMESARSPRDQASLALNIAKWEAAHAWCRRQGVRFRVVTEQDIFTNLRSR
jgi:hypothetical protein